MNDFISKKMGHFSSLSGEGQETFKDSKGFPFQKDEKLAVLKIGEHVFNMEKMDRTFDIETKEHSFNTEDFYKKMIVDTSHKLLISLTRSFEKRYEIEMIYGNEAALVDQMLEDAINTKSTSIQLAVDFERYCLEFNIYPTFEDFKVFEMFINYNTYADDDQIKEIVSAIEKYRMNKNEQKFTGIKFEGDDHNEI
ncbi:MAG TPA: hypothetical protein VJU85_05155 [Nitrososphaeraceae archaeon]|nr:hypothetical protein [Nitrososphaeraceae archaeon]